MSYHYKRTYTGPVQAVIFDWAGTVVDFGSLAPIDGFCMLFEQNGVPISQAEARIPMGTEKYEHICQLLAIPRIHQAWIDQHGQPAGKADTDRLYKEFVPIQIKAINKRAHLIPGAKETVDYLQGRGIKVGSNTGYSQEMIKGLVQEAAGQGFTPQSIVAATDVPRGRPFPHMTLKNLIELEVENLQACVKVDDTVPGILEGLNAGLWTVGVVVSGNEAGLELAEWQALSAEEQNKIRQRGREQLYQAGAHYVIDSVADLPEVIDDIEQRLSSNHS